MFPRLLFVLFCVALCACAVRPAAISPNVSVGGFAHLPAPLTAAGDAAPKIVAVRFSSLTVRRPGLWRGTIITSTNVASLEVRSNQFSINVPRVDFGRFAFQLRIFDVPDQFIRTYNLRIIARNAAGQQTEEDVPFRIE